MGRGSVARAGRSVVSVTWLLRRRDEPVDSTRDEDTNQEPDDQDDTDEESQPEQRRELVHEVSVMSPPLVAAISPSASVSLRGSPTGASGGRRTIVPSNRRRT